jgi:formate-dependent nitrite reductase cytochrome c552 subunit
MINLPTVLTNSVQFQEIVAYGSQCIVDYYGTKDCNALKMCWDQGNDIDDSNYEYSDVEMMTAFGLVLQAEALLEGECGYYEL